MYSFISLLTMLKLDVEIVDPDLARQFEVTARAPRETIIVNPADAGKLN